MKNNFFYKFIITLLFFMSTIIFSENIDTGIKVYDYANLFSKENSEILSKMAAKVSKEKQMDIVIVTINDSEGKSSRDYADDFFDYNNFGYGSDRSGILMLVNMQEREVWLSTSGKGITVYTDRVISSMLDSIYKELSVGNYTLAGEKFIKESNNYIEKYEEGLKPLRERYPIYAILLSSLMLGFGLSAIFTIIKNNKEKNRYIKRVKANNYLTKDGMNFTVMKDQFLLTNTSRIHSPIQRSSSSSSGGSTTHRSSSGRSHGGGGRKF